MGLADTLQKVSALVVRQRHELAEVFGFETRNKYVIQDENEFPIGFAAEQRKGLGAFFGRQILGHWRSFEIFIFNNEREMEFHVRHPFRFYFTRLEVARADGRPIGAIEKRFSILSKKFDLHDSSGRTILSCASPIWRIWTFPFLKDGVQRAVVKKTWGGVFTEAITDADTFHIEFTDERLGADERALILAASVFIDLQYFEQKASNKRGVNVFANEF